MTLFKNRIDAGQKLALKLIDYAYKENTLILALPRGGVVTAFESAKALHLPLDVITPRKIGAPMNPEYAIGAVMRDGQALLNELEIKRLHIPDEYLRMAIKKEAEEAKRREDYFRAGRAPLDVKDKVLIIIDDGMATGLTMRATLEFLKSKNPRKLIVALPVAPSESLAKLKNLADIIICLETPLVFYAVGQFYEEFAQTTDEEVIAILKTNTTIQ